MNKKKTSKNGTRFLTKISSLFYLYRLNDVYGGKIGCEWLLPKVLEVYFTDRACFDLTYAFVEAGDFVAYNLCKHRKTHGANGNVVNIPRSACQLGYKGTFDTSTKQYYVTSSDLARIFNIANVAAVEKILDCRGKVLKPGNKNFFPECNDACERFILYKKNKVWIWWENSRLGFPFTHPSSMRTRAVIFWVATPTKRSRAS